MTTFKMDPFQWCEYHLNHQQFKLFKTYVPEVFLLLQWSKRHTCRHTSEQYKHLVIPTYPDDDAWIETCNYLTLSTYIH